MIAGSGCTVPGALPAARRKPRNWPLILRRNRYGPINGIGATGMTDRQITTTTDEIERAVKKAVSAAFRDVGINAHDDDAVDQRRRDFQFLHDLRTTSESAKAKVGAFFLLSAVGALLTIIVLGFRAWISGR